MSHLHAEKLVEELKENAKEFAQVAYDAVKNDIAEKVYHALEYPEDVDLAFADRWVVQVLKYPDMLEWNAVNKKAK